MTFIPTKRNSITPFNHNKILLITSKNNITYHNYYFVDFDQISTLLIALKITPILHKHNLNLINIINLTYNYKLY